MAKLEPKDYSSNLGKRISAVPKFRPSLGTVKGELVNYLTGSGDMYGIKLDQEFIPQNTSSRVSDTYTVKDGTVELI